VDGKCGILLNRIKSAIFSFTPILYNGIIFVRY